MAIVTTQGLSSGEQAARWTAFFEEADLRKRVLQIAESYPIERSLRVDFGDLERSDRLLADAFLLHPEETVRAGEQAIRDLLPASISLPAAIRLRVEHLPSSQKVPIHLLRKGNLGHAVAIDGIVRRATTPLPQVVEGVFECGACRQKIRWPQERTLPVLRTPPDCDPQQNGCGKPAARARFNFLEAESITVDFQRLEVQEEPEGLRGGTHPESLTVLLAEDLVEQIAPGTRVTLNGVLHPVPRPVPARGAGATSNVLDVVLLANSVERRSKEYMEIDISEEERQEIERWRGDPRVFDRIVDSLAPSIKGMKMEKKAIALQLFGGVEKTLPDGVHIRGDSHVLLIGDPGTAKSQLLMYVARTAPRGVYTSGKGTTSAGLTAAAVRDDFAGGRWVLEAGAMVLADGGMLCLHPSSEVLVDGLPVPIASLFSEARAQAVRSRAGEVLETVRLGSSTVSFNVSSLSPRNSTATHVVRRRYQGPLIRLELDSGFCLRVTPSHPLLTAENLGWKSAADVRVGDHLVAPQRLPGRQEPVWILDVIPEDWIVQPLPPEKEELAAATTERFGSFKEVARKFGIPRDAFLGRSAFRVGPFRTLLKELGLYEAWRARPLGFSRGAKPDRLRCASIGPDLAYILGFIYGDGSVSISRRRSTLAVVQSEVHSAYIRRFLEATRTVHGDPWHDHRSSSSSRIRGRPVNSESHVHHKGSQTLGALYSWTVGDGLRNLLALPDESLRGFLAGAFDADGCISIRASRGSSRHPMVSILLSDDTTENRRLLLALRRLDIFGRIRPARGVKKIEVSTREDVERLMEALLPFSAKARRVPPGVERHSGDHQLVPQPPIVALLRKLKVRPTELLRAGLWSTYHEVLHGTRAPMKAAMRRLLQIGGSGLTARERARFQALTANDFASDRVVRVSRESYSGFVYDLRAPEESNFSADGVIVHNCIDEIDKMSPEDRSSMHEAMEAQQISVSKAGISATLRARCPVLAAANPKFGRFTTEQQPQKQFALQPTLLSRFDVILPVRDRPDAEADQKLAHALLEQHHTAEERESRRMRVGEIPAETGADLFSQDFLKKFVAYAKQNVRPVMDEEAYRRLEAYYVNMRKVVPAEMEEGGEGGGVAITPRQLEALVRLTEASAKSRLSAQASVQDAERAIEVIDFFLQQMTSTESGRRDIDLVYSGFTSSQRDTIGRVRNLMRALQTSSPFGFTEASLIDLGKEQKIPEDAIKKALKELKDANEVYQPREGLYKLA